MNRIFKNRPLIAYFPMWHSQQNWTDCQQSRLVNVIDDVNVLVLSFVDPAKAYQGNLNAPISDYFFEGEGKALGESGLLIDLKNAIQACRLKVRGRKILVSAGGEIGGEFINANFASLAALIADLDLDGLDLDYEPAGGMAQTAAQVSLYRHIISAARAALDAQTDITGKRYLLSCAPTAVGLVNQQTQSSTFIEPIKNRLSTIIAANEQHSALCIGATDSDPACPSSTALSIFNFPSAGKMKEVFLHENDGAQVSISRYPYIGNMVDVVIYQAYNMGSANLLGRILCYESYRLVADFLQQKTGKTRFCIVHGSHIGQEAWPKYSHTLSRLKTIYQYICEYGDVLDGASFWAYGQDATDQQDYLPDHGMGYTNSAQVFEEIATLFKHAKVAALKTVQ